MLGFAKVITGVMIAAAASIPGALAPATLAKWQEDIITTAGVVKLAKVGTQLMVVAAASVLRRFGFLLDALALSVSAAIHLEPFVAKAGVAVRLGLAHVVGHLFAGAGLGVLVAETDQFGSRTLPV